MQIGTKGRHKKQGLQEIVEIKSTVTKMKNAFDWLIHMDLESFEIHNIENEQKGTKCQKIIWKLKMMYPIHHVKIRCIRKRTKAKNI